MHVVTPQRWRRGRRAAGKQLADEMCHKERRFVYRASRRRGSVLLGADGFFFSFFFFCGKRLVDIFLKCPEGSQNLRLSSSQYGCDTQRRAE